MFETVTSGVIDFFPEQLTDKRVLVNIVTGLVVFVLSIPFTLNVSSISSLPPIYLETFRLYKLIRQIILSRKRLQDVQQSNAAAYSRQTKGKKSK